MEILVIIEVVVQLPDAMQELGRAVKKNYSFRSRFNASVGAGEQPNLEMTLQRSYTAAERGLCNPHFLGRPCEVAVLVESNRVFDEPEIWKLGRS